MNNHEPSDNRAFSSHTVDYPDATRLLRPQNLPMNTRFVVLIFMVVAALIGALGVYKTADAIYFSKIRTEEAIAKNCAQQVPYDFPVLTEWMALGSDEAKSKLEQSYNLVEFSKPEDYPNGGFDVFKLPSTVSKEEGSAALKNGISGITALDASKVLNGGWRFTMDLTNYIDLRVRYTDLTSKTVSTAIQNALMSQGLSGDAVKFTGEGTDESGNTYKAGTIEVGGTTYFWRISALNFNDAYSISGFPKDAIYVGIRFTN